MVNTVAAARAGRSMALGLLPAAGRVTKALVWNPQWRTPGCELRAYLRTALTTGFLAACGGLLAMIILRGYTIYG